MVFNGLAYLPLKEQGISSNLIEPTMEKIELADFVRLLHQDLHEFHLYMKERNFSPRNNNEWFRLLADYLGASEWEERLERLNENEDPEDQA